MPFRCLPSFVTPPGECSPREQAPATPMRQRPHAYTRMGLGSRGFARRYSRDLG